MDIVEELKFFASLCGEEVWNRFSLGWDGGYWSASFCLEGRSVMILDRDPMKALLRLHARYAEMFQVESSSDMTSEGRRGQSR